MSTPQQDSLSGIPSEVPESFFRDITPTDSSPPPLVMGNGRVVTSTGLPSTERPNQTLKALALYDVIIDDMFSNPGTSFTKVAERLRKSPQTISLICRSDFFKARWIQRREQYNSELAHRLHSKMATAVEKSLDATISVLETKPNIPLAELKELNTSLLDRLGYSPKREGGPGGVNVQINQNNGGAASVATSNAQASPEALSRAQNYLRILEEQNASSGARPGNASIPTNQVSEGSFDGGPVVEGEVVQEEPR